MDVPLDAPEKQWAIKPVPHPERAEALAAELGIDPVLAELLVQRGVETFGQAKQFFRPQREDLHDPFLMKDMDKAVERLHRAITEGERILIFGDYDVDGTTAVAEAYSFVKALTPQVEYYIPDRHTEGYGLSYKALDWATEAGFGLVVTLDCGIKDIDKVDYAATKGIDVIVCDHHLPERELPKAVAVLDPKREDCTYPFDDLCGCGVGFKLLQGYTLRYGLDPALLEPLFDLQAVSIASDLVSMTGENRVLAHYGLKRLNEAPREGLLAMIRVAQLEPGHIGMDDIVFKIGPRINAAGRMESGKLAVELLTATDAGKAREIGEKINAKNNLRKSIDREITQEALEMVQSGHALCDGPLTMVYSPNWNKGVVGIVASRLVETYYKPAFVLTQSNGFVTGSARSVPGFDLYAAIEQCADLMDSFGGHIHAAGVTLREENLDEFRKRMETYVAENITKHTLTPVVEIDRRLDFDRITPKFIRILRQFQPFGPGNANPVFLAEEVYDTGSGRRVGAGGSHLKLDLVQEGQHSSRPITALGFNMADYAGHMLDGNPVDICYSVVENFYKGYQSTQLRIKDIRKRDSMALLPPSGQTAGPGEE